MIDEADQSEVLKVDAEPGNGPGGVAAEFDNTYAFAEGWGLFDDGEIQRLDDMHDGGEPVFDGDDAAIAFVRRMAAMGSKYHSAALSMLADDRRLTRENTEAAVAFLKSEAALMGVIISVDQAKQHIGALLDLAHEIVHEITG